VEAVELVADVSERLASWHSYPKVFALGHGAIKDLLLDDVVVQEKVDGSQFSFGKFINDAGEEEIRCRSKGAQLNILAPEKMFTTAVAAVLARKDKLHLGWTYRGEVLAKPKHNTLAYERTPKDHIILFDIGVGRETYMLPDQVTVFAQEIGLEYVPVFHQGKIETLDFFRTLLDHTSVLGAQKIEGVVVKNYKRFSIDGHVMMGKFVSETFKEVHGTEWKKTAPKSGDILEVLCAKYKHPARWTKAIQRLRDAGVLTQSPKDIGPLIHATQGDVLAECEDEIKDALFKWAWPHVERKCVAGLPEFYKEELLKQQFNAQP
jgi:hypothetical protein